MPMTSDRVRMLAVAVCSCAVSAGAGAAEWRYAAATAADLMPQAAVPAKPGCGPEEPCIRLWGEMSAAERAKIWPYLDEVAKSTHWREMNRKEKEDLKAHLSDSDRDRLRHRFSVDPSLAEVDGGELDHPKKGVHPTCLDVRKLNKKERRRMREQILEMHERIQ